jgi:general secretion pathway protein N
MKKIWSLVALGVLAYVVFALVTLPAGVVAARLQPPGVNIGGVTGTAWNGSAQVVQVGGTNLGALTWKLHALPLFALRAVADFKLTRTDGFAQGTISATRQTIVLTDTTASLPLAMLPPQVAPGGWTGTLNAKLASLSLANGWPTHVDGTIEAMELTGPARRPANIGSYQVKFPVAGNPVAGTPVAGTPVAGSPAADVLVGAVSDIGGPIQIAGTIQLNSADRSYLVEGMVATKPDAPPDFARTLEYLGPPDEQGRRQFSLSGTM